MQVSHDLPNEVYRILANQIYILADHGATEEELQKLFSKGGRVTLKDIAKIDAKHTRYVDETAKLSVPKSE